MPLPALAEITDFEEWSGVEVEAEDRARVDSYLMAASVLVRSEAHETFVDAEGALETDIPDAIGTVVVMVAARVWSNPEGFIAEGEGPFTGTRHKDAGQVLYLTETEKTLIHRAIGADTDPAPGLWTLGTTRLDNNGTPDLPSVFLDTEPAGDPMPWVNYGGF